MKILILMPILNDWVSAAEVLRRIDAAFSPSGDSVSVVLVNDGSSEPQPVGFGEGPYEKLTEVSCLILKRNVGHQRALAIGLCHISDEIPCDVILVMDSDGEDEATDAKRLIDRTKLNAKPAVVFAERMKRSESALFKICYWSYRWLHIILTGHRIRVGNFSAVPWQLLPGITIEPMLWNHYAASIIGSRIAVDFVPTNRGKRIDGKSRLNFSSLVIHGLSALACYNETIGVRLLMFMGIPLVLALLSILTITCVKLFSTLAIPGWASITSILIAVLLLQMATLISNFVLQTIATRSAQPFLPARDYGWFIQNIIWLHGSKG